MRRPRRFQRTILLVGMAGTVFAAAIGWSRVAAQQPTVDQAMYSGLRWRLLGPFRGGRVDAVSGVPGHPNQFYFGSVNGGVWKSVDAGRIWTPVFDSQPVASIGALAVAASNPDVVYVGSGESTLRDSVGYGNGMYKSVDAGRTWTHIGLDNTEHIGKVAIDPKNTDTVFVAAIGHLYAAGPDRGVFRSRDGGRTWQKVLFKNERRRRRRRDRSGELSGDLRVALEHAAPAVVHVSAVERARRRHFQIGRWRRHLDPADQRAALGLCRPQRRGDRRQ